MAKVSIIIPCYDQGQFLEETLESVWKQTYKDWECIIIDDGSTDNTFELAKKAAKADSRIHVLSQPNRGVNAARNRGILASKGKYIQFLDADDLIEPEKMETQVGFLEQNPEVGITYTEVLLFRSTVESPGQCLIQPGRHVPDFSGEGFELILLLTSRNIAAIHSPMVRRDVFDQVGLLNESYTHAEDWEFWWRCAIKGISFYYYYRPNSAALYRVQPFGASSLSLMMIIGEIRLRQGKHWQLQYKKAREWNIRALVFAHIKHFKMIWNLAKINSFGTLLKQLFLFLNLFFRSPIETQIRYLLSLIPGKILPV